MELLAGIDLHSDNGYLGIADMQGKRLYDKKLPNELPRVLAALEPYRDGLKGVIIESTYNWYWLVDGLMDQGYPVFLANPSAIVPYWGLKNIDDKSSAFFLIELKRLGILPTGYIYPKGERAVRDLLRRRILLVQQRTCHLLSFGSLVSRQTGSAMNTNCTRTLADEDLEPLLGQEDLVVLAGQTNLALIRALTQRIGKIESAALKKVKLRPEYKKLLTVPGIGKILAMTIMLETGEIGRFAGVGNYSSYCRCVKASWTSNGKVKGKGNRKNGNKYLAWAFVEAANFARRYCPEARAYHQKKAARTHGVVATKALANKLCKACYFILKNQEDFQLEKIFGVKKGGSGEPVQLLAQSLQS
jgi:transposase